MTVITRITICWIQCVYKLRDRNTFAPSRGDLETMFFLKAQSMSGEFFGRLIATGKWGVCLLSSCKVRHPQNKNIFQKTLKVKMLSSDIKYMMFFGVNVQEID